MKGEPLVGFVCPTCKGELTRATPELVRCSGAGAHEFPLREGAPVLLPEGDDRAIALAGIAEASAKWAASRGDRWESARRKVWKALLRAAVETAPPPGLFADLGAGAAGLATLAAHARYQAAAVDAGMPPEGPYLRTAASFEALPFADGSLRVAAFVASLHYAVSVGGALAEARRALREDGALLIALTPVHGSAEGADEAAASTRDAIRGQVGDTLLARTYRHLTRPELWEALQQAGFTVEERPPGFGAGYAAMRAVRAKVTGGEFAAFPMLVCRRKPGGGQRP